MFAGQGQSPGAAFGTTSWSLIYSSKIGQTQAGWPEGFGEVYEIYLRPIFGFVRRQGYSSQEAEDLTQDFLLSILAGNLLRAADPKRGRFRSLVLKSLKNFLLNADIKQRRFKRGGRFQFIAWS